MPIYEFKCESCNSEFEKLCQVDEELEECPECEEPEVKRLISKTSFKLKGSGWWETDYNQSDDQPDETQGDDSEPESDPENESETTESTEATQAES